MSKQLLRSGTSIGANLCEADYAVSHKEFIVKLQISLKEAAESKYWLELLFNTKAKFVLSTWHHNDWRSNDMVEKYWKLIEINGQAVTAESESAKKK